MKGRREAISEAFLRVFGGGGWSKYVRGRGFEFVEEAGLKVGEDSLRRWSRESFCGVAGDLLATGSFLRYDVRGLRSILGSHLPSTKKRIVSSIVLTRKQMKTSGYQLNYGKRFV